jgi:hypothetical protein
MPVDPKVYARRKKRRLLNKPSPEDDQYIRVNIRSLKMKTHILDLFSQGCTIPGISKKMEISRSAVREALREAIKMERSKYDESREDAVQFELKRLQRLIKLMWAKAKDGKIKATSVILRILERRSKLLGLDAPTKVVGDYNTNHTGTIQHKGLLALAEKARQSTPTESGVAANRQERLDKIKKEILGEN